MTITPDNPPFIEEVWCGSPIYRCTRCKYDSGDAADLVQHFVTEHAPPPEPWMPDTAEPVAAGADITTDDAATTDAEE